MQRRICVAMGAWAVLAAGAGAQPLNGTVEQHSFTGPVTGKAVLFNIYLPAGYAASSQRYPVVYHLHGLGGNQGGGQNTQVPGAFETALAQCRIGPVIVVFPNGYTDNFWADSIDGNQPAETNVALELVPHVDANFRTIPHVSNRVVQGFSMGGFGAMKFYSKFPDLFTCGIEYDGALVTWNDLLQSHPAIASQVFGNSQAYFNIYSPWVWMNTNAPTLGQNLNIRMLAGVLVAGNRRFRDYLIGLNIPRDYVETGCDHTLPCLLGAQGQNSASFIAARLKPYVADAPGGTCRGGNATITVHGAGKGPFTYGWEMADPQAPGGWRWLASGSVLVADGRAVGTVLGAGQSLTIDTSGYRTDWEGGLFRVAVHDACGGSVISNTAAIEICGADYNCDGFVDGIDADWFNNDFEAGDEGADYNRDGFVDGMDYDRFHNEFEAGC